MAIPRLSRRSVVRGFLVTAGSAVVGYLTARGVDAAGESSGTAAGTDYGPAPKAGATRPIAALEDIPDGGLVLAGARVVLVRDGTSVRGFSALCTHRNCTVSTIKGGVVSCPCHGSRFDVSSGAVLSGPATRPLPEVAVAVLDGSVYRA